MTTNAGSDNSAALVGFSGDPRDTERQKTEKALSSFLRPEFINRVDEIITFRQLDVNDFKKIAIIMLDELKAALSEKGIALSYKASAVEIIAEESYSAKYGARNMRRYIQTEVEDKLAELIIADYNHKYTKAVISSKGGKIHISCM